MDELGPRRQCTSDGAVGIVGTSSEGSAPLPQNQLDDLAVVDHDDPFCRVENRLWKIVQIHGDAVKVVRDRYRGRLAPGGASTGHSLFATSATLAIQVRTRSRRLA